LKVNQSATLIADTASLCHFSNNFFYVRGGSAGLSIGDDNFSNSITLTDNADIAFEAGSALRMRILASGNVGIGTSSPFSRLHVQDSANFGTIAVGNNSFPALITGDGGSGAMTLDNRAGVVGWIAFRPSGSGATQGAEVARFTSSGLTFNGDTAAANALDDYEEGTFTPTISFGNASVGVSYSASTSGRYTKIGRQVSITCLVILTSKGSSSGPARIGGLPFAIANANGFYSSGSLSALSNITFGGQIQAYSEINSTNFVLNETSEAGVQSDITEADFANNTQIVFSATYFV
jgi:hypothetical protein